MKDLIINVIGWGSIITLSLMYYYADDLNDNNIERLTKEKNNETFISQTEI